jgi:integrase
MEMATIKRTTAGTYRADICINKERRCKVFPTENEAELWVEEHAPEIRAGKYKDTKLAAKTKLATVLEQFCEAKSKKRRTQTASEIEVGRVERMLKLPIAQKTMLRINEAAVEKWALERLQVIKPATLRREINILRAVFVYANGKMKIHTPTNPFAGEIDALSDAELAQSYEDNEDDFDDEIGRDFYDGEEARLLAAIQNGCRNTEIESLYLLALETGLRRNEITALKWGDFRGSTLCVRRVEDKRCTLTGARRTVQRTKSNKSYSIPLSTRGREILEKLPRSEEGGFIFASTYNALKLAWKRAKDRANSDLRWHDLRHIAITRACEAFKGDPVKLKAFARHSSIKMTGRYIHLRNQLLSEELDAAVLVRSARENKSQVVV